MNFDISFNTKRLIIKPLENVNSHFIFELLNTPLFIKNIGNRNIKNKKDAKNYIETINNKPDTYFLVVELDSKLIGLVTLIKREYLVHFDIGFAFLPLYFGKGYAFEASFGLLNYLKENTKLKTILGITVPSNENSIKLLENLGLNFEKKIQHKEEELSCFRLDL
jgi:[ribosomal protein S5]-alanine N-acetyltransferase